MYQNQENFFGRITADVRRRAFENRPKPGAVLPVERPYTPARAPRWAGSWRPRRFMDARINGMLGEDLPTFPAEVPAYVPAAVNMAPYTVTAQPTGWLENLFSGIGSIITPAAQSLIGIKTAGMITQQQQRTLAQTYNPAITGPAIQAQGWQAAYQGGTGASPGIGMGTVGLIAAGGLLLWALTRK